MSESSSFEATLDSLASSIDSVESIMAPVFERPLEETLAELPGPIERARLLFWLSYTIHSCSWIYAKLRAVDPETHGVMDEIKRIQKYNGKILAALDASTNDSTASSSTDNRMKVDKDAASRFIKAAIATQPSQSARSEPLIQEGPGPHSRLKSLALASVKAPVTGGDGESSSSEDDLLVEEGDLAANDDLDTQPLETDTTSEQSSAQKPKNGKKKDKQKRKRDEDSVSLPAKSKILDPLAGYDDVEGERKARRTGSSSEGAGPSSKRRKDKKKGKAKA